MVFGSIFQVVFTNCSILLQECVKIVQINEKNHFFLCKDFTTGNLGLSMRTSIRRVGRARFNAPDLKSDEESNLPEVLI